MLSEALGRVEAGEQLDSDVAEAAVGAIVDGAADDDEAGRLLEALRQRGEGAAEICGGARALRRRMLPLPLPRRPQVDTCGTGGDGLGLFNISTAAAFVLAACGITVAKHGNRAVSSRAGSSDVLGALGVAPGTPQTAAAQLRAHGLTFLHAPAFHPALARVAALRRRLGGRTLFNLLGPLCNPAAPTHQLLGVGTAPLLAPVAAALTLLGDVAAWVVHGDDGADEVSACGPTRVRAAGTLAARPPWAWTPADAGLRAQPLAALVGGDAAHNAALMEALLRGAAGPLRDAVALNAGAALLLLGRAPSLREGTAQAAAALAGGGAWRLVEALRPGAGSGDGGAALSTPG